jgi:zinc transporter ZupT
MITFGLALFLHSFIDGIAVGLFEESKALWVLSWSVILHKIPVSFTLGFTF